MCSYYLLIASLPIHVHTGGLQVTWWFSIHSLIICFLSILGSSMVRLRGLPGRPLTCDPLAIFSSGGRTSVLDICTKIHRKNKESGREAMSETMTFIDHKKSNRYSQSRYIHV